MLGVRGEDWSWIQAFTFLVMQGPLQSLLSRRKTDSEFENRGVAMLDCSLYPSPLAAVRVVTAALTRSPLAPHYELPMSRKDTAITPSYNSLFLSRSTQLITQKSWQPPTLTHLEEPSSTRSRNPSPMSPSTKRKTTPSPPPSFSKQPNH
jgi:hypothetical protein